MRILGFLKKRTEVLSCAIKVGEGSEDRFYDLL
jgi:hypothetical protein